MRALLVYPTHDNGREALQPYLEAGVSAACFPARSTTGEANCWNTVADEAESLGLPVMKSVCPACRELQRCRAAGYQGQVVACTKRDVLIATHKRAEYSGLEELAVRRSYVSIHENPVDLLRPVATIDEPDLVVVREILRRMLDDPVFLDWFGEDSSTDNDGNRYYDEELARRRERLYDFVRQLDFVAELLAGDIERAERTRVWDLPLGIKLPQGLERTLLRACRMYRLRFAGQPWRCLLAAASGDLHAAAILVEERRIRGGDIVRHRSLIGVLKNEVPAATVWFSDATLDADRLAGLVGQPIRDGTPSGTITRRRKAVQIPRDVTRGTTSGVFVALLQGVLADRPAFRRVGVICHSAHTKALDELSKPFRERIVRHTYFGSGEERSSNAWHRECDLIVVAGTPRVPPATISRYLIQVDRVEAACREPRWGKVLWWGHTEPGEPIRVAGRGYHDVEWRAAHRDLVRAAIVQAVGRGRGILDEGCEVLVLSTEECGLPISDAQLALLGGKEALALVSVTELAAEIPKKHSLGISAVITSDVAQRCELSERRTRELLASLEARGLVRKVGDRRGWLPVGVEEPVLQEAPA